jgi:hypothetical protein
VTQRREIVFCYLFILLLFLGDGMTRVAITVVLWQRTRRLLFGVEPGDEQANVSPEEVQEEQTCNLCAKECRD